MNAPLDPYRVLQILPDADQEEIKVAFRRLARRYHPDRAPDAASMARMIEVNRAWELIGDPVRRAAYDRANGIVRGPRPVERVRRDPAPGSPSPESADTREPGEPSDTTPGHTSGRTPHPAGSPGVGSEAVSGAAGPPGQGPGHRPSPASDPVRRDDPTDGRAPVRPGRPSGTVLTFGRYEGWSLGEMATRGMGRFARCASEATTAEMSFRFPADAGASAMTYQVGSASHCRTIATVSLGLRSASSPTRCTDWAWT